MSRLILSLIVVYVAFCPPSDFPSQPFAEEQSGSESALQCPSSGETGFVDLEEYPPEQLRLNFRNSVNFREIHLSTVIAFHRRLAWHCERFADERGIELWTHYDGLLGFPTSGKFNLDDAFKTDESKALQWHVARPERSVVFQLGLSLQQCPQSLGECQLNSSTSVFFHVVSIAGRKKIDDKMDELDGLSVREFLKPMLVPEWPKKKIPAAVPAGK